MELSSGNKKEVADILKIDRKTLYRRLEEYGWTDS
jgi:DNA-binding NtrC family response regulator